MSAGSVAVLFSGGKDSALAALLLEPFYDVTLVTGSVGVTEDWRHAERAAEGLALPFQRVDLDRAVLEDALQRLQADGYPRNAIQLLHEHALETAAGLEFDAVADGTRRDDRTPRLSRADAQSLEDRHGVDYLVPLAGVGRGAVDRLVDAHLEVTHGPSAEVDRADYEAELRALLTEVESEAAVADAFPEHEQSVVTGRR